MPLQLAVAYAEFVRGIFYHREVLDFWSANLQVESEQEIEAAKNSLMEKGYAGELYHRPVVEWIDRLFESVQKVLTDEQNARLQPLYELVQKRMTPAQALSGVDGKAGLGYE